MRRGLVLACLCACGEDPQPPPNECVPDPSVLRDPALPDAHIELGSGQLRYDELVEDGQIILIHGPQGGYHLPLNVRIFGMEPGDPSDFTSGPLTLFTVLDEGGNSLAYFPCAVTFPYVPSADAVGGAFQLDRPQAMIIPNDMVPAIYGRRVLARVQVLDRDGRWGTDEAHATVIVNEPAIVLDFKHVTQTAEP